MHHALHERAGRIALQAVAPASAPTAETATAATSSQRSISCVIPCLNEADNLRVMLPRLTDILESTSMRWEILVIDDGSTDDTLAVMSAWCQRPGVRYIRLSRNFGKEAALSAGLKASHGDAVVMLDGDLQHSPSLILEMLAHWRNGAEVVYALRQGREDERAFKRWGSELFYRLVNAWSRVDMPKDAGDFRLMDRRVVEALLSLPERNRFMKGLYAWVGFRSVALPYTPAQRTRGTSAFRPIRLLHLALDGLTSFTTWPLRLVSVCGLLIATPAFAYGVFLIVDHFVVGDAISGWSTIVVSLMFFIGVQMISTGIVGEYVARIFEEVKGRPLYVVSRELGTGLEEEAS